MVSIDAAELDGVITAGPAGSKSPRLLGKFFPILQNSSSGWTLAVSILQHLKS